MKSKILFIILNGKEYGGSEKHVVDIINNLDKDKYELHLIMSNGNPMKNNLEICSENIHLINRNNPISLVQIKRIIKTIKPNIVHAHAARGIFYARLVCKTLKKKLKIKLICTAHGWILEYLHFNKLLQKMFLLNKDIDDATLTVSRYSMEEMISKGYDKEKLSYIYNGINVEDYNKIARIKESIKTIAYMGRFTNQKGIVYLMESLKDWKESNIKFDIYGKGELKDYIIQCIQNDKLSNVELHDFVPAKEVPNVMQEIDLLLLPSIDEGFPYILVEAIASGVPCIATNVGGVKEIIDDKVGALIESKDSKLITKAIQQLLNSNVKELSRNCVKRSEKYSIKEMITKLEGIYNIVSDNKF